jgi:type IV secretion system protein TrbB
MRLGRAMSDITISNVNADAPAPITRTHVIAAQAPANIGTAATDPSVVRLVDPVSSDSLRPDLGRPGDSDLRCLETRLRRRAMLRTAMGPAIAQALEDDDVVEVMVNADGRLWVDRHGAGRCATDVTLMPREAERIIRLVASHIRAEASTETPIVSAELPETGERFEGLLPPVTTAPSFAIRRPISKVVRLRDYVAAGSMTMAQALYLSAAVHQAKNVLIAGGTGSGKTTLVNALLAEMATLHQRIVLIEDTRELLCAADDMVALRTKPGVVSLCDLVRSTMRLRPDRIIVGEVRGGEALDMLKAWNTGHPGGVATLHANSAHAALYRLEQLIQEVVNTVPRRLIAEAVDVVVFISGRGLSRRIESIAIVSGLSESGDYRIETLMGSKA